MAIIDRFDLDISSIDEIKNLKHYNTKVGENWPVVYVLNNDKEAYVDELVHVTSRTKQNLSNEKKVKANEN